MCSLTLALTGLTTGLQMAGQYQQSRAQAAAYESQAQAAKQQADAAYQNARIQNRKGEQIAEQYAQKQREMDARRRLAIGQNVAAAGSAGIQGGVGSVLDIYNSSMEAWKDDSLDLLSNQRNSLYDNYVQEVNQRNRGNELTAQSNNLRAQADAAKTAGNWAMIGTAITALGSAHSSGLFKGSAKTATQPTTASGFLNDITGTNPTPAVSYGYYSTMNNVYWPKPTGKGLHLFGR